MHLPAYGAAILAEGQTIAQSLQSMWKMMNAVERKQVSGGWKAQGYDELGGGRLQNIQVVRVDLTERGHVSKDLDEGGRESWQHPRDEHQAEGREARIPECTAWKQ